MVLDESTKVNFIIGKWQSGGQMEKYIKFNGQMVFMKRSGSSYTYKYKYKYNYTTIQLLNIRS